jgi:hypothetical protein
MASTRGLAAILAADVAGYSRLMGADEEGTHERLKAHFRQLIDPKIKEHQGRIVKNTGDRVLAEFPSVVDAVRAPPKCSAGCSTASRGSPTSGASGSGSASISASMPGLFPNGGVLPPSSSDGARVREPRNPGGPRCRQDKRARQQADESSTMRNPEATDALESEMTVGRLGAGAGSRAATAMLSATARGELVQGLDPD